MISVMFTDIYLRLSAAAVTVVLGGFLIWAAFVPLAEGTAASGSVEVEMERQVVQHLEGGIIRSIHVAEGDSVARGEPLVELEDLSARVERDQIAQRAGALDAAVQRLDALMRGAESFDFVNLDYLELDEATLGEILARQRRLFESQRDDLASDLAVIEAGIEAARDTADLTGAELESTRAAAAAAEEELALARRLVERQMGRVDRVRRLEREVASLRSAISRLERQIAQARAEQRQLNAQAGQVRADFLQAISRELVEARESWLAAREELFAAQDVVNRSIITAPSRGSVFNLRFATEGGVVRPGEVLLADLKTDPDTGQTYYAASIRLDDAAVEGIDGLEILPGMPVQAFIFSGRKRTTLDYLLSPLLDSLFEGLRAP